MAVDTGQEISTLISKLAILTNQLQQLLAPYGICPKPPPQTKHAAPQLAAAEQSDVTASALTPASAGKDGGGLQASWGQLGQGHGRLQGREQHGQTSGMAISASGGGGEGYRGGGSSMPSRGEVIGWEEVFHRSMAKGGKLHGSLKDPTDVSNWLKQVSAVGTIQLYAAACSKISGQFC